MARRGHNAIPRRRAGPRPRRYRRATDPRFYLSAVIVVASVGLVALPALADFYLAAARPTAEPGESCRIYQVVDGDTVRMWCPRRGSIKARFTGFDTPELFSPACPSELAAAMRASWALRLTLLRAGEVRLVHEGTDRYGRALVTAFIDGAPLAGRMIAAGRARAYSGGQRQGWCA